MYVPECSYWITVSGPADKRETAAAMLDALPTISESFRKDMDEDGDIHYEVKYGTISQWIDVEEEIGEVAAANPDVSIQVEEIDEDSHDFHRLYQFKGGKLKEVKFGRRIDPGEYDLDTIHHCIDLLKGEGFQEAAQWLTKEAYTDG